ncbi:MAG: DUF6377 domain-containing protein [Rikenellaceae bacterium]
MRNIFLIFMLVPICLLASEQRVSNETKLAELDAAILNIDIYQEAKNSRIEQLKYSISTTQDRDQQQILNVMLYGEYAKYDSNAAFELVSEMLTENNINGEIKNHASWSIRRAFLYTASGLLKEAFDTLDYLRPTLSDDQTLLMYYQQMEYLNSHMGQYSFGNDKLSPSYYERKTSYTDSISLVINDKDRYYLINKGWQHYNSDSTEYYRKKIEERYLSSNRDNSDDAMDAYTVAHLYNSKGDNQKFTTYLIESAIADVKSCNHDIASLQELAKIMLTNGDVERAYSYLSYALERAKNFGDRVRIMEISTLLDATYSQLLTKNKVQSKRLAIFSLLIFLFFCVVVTLSLNVIMKNKKLRVALSNLDKANLNLDQHILQLEQVNQNLSAAHDNLKELNNRLMDSNFIKENYIANTFEVCSTHISKMEKIFTKIATLVRSNKTEELRRYCDSSLLVNSELKVMYEAFDYTFLKMYPNFIDNFNKLLLPDKQIKLRSHETLNTELRIIALNRLGISDNQKISTILHCSVQTVYNNLQKTKNRTELSGKELLAAIQNID